MLKVFNHARRITIICITLPACANLIVGANWNRHQWPLVHPDTMWIHPRVSDNYTKFTYTLRMWHSTSQELCPQIAVFHYCDVIMGAKGAQIISLTILYSTVHSGADQRKHWSFASLALCGEFTGHWWIPRTNGQWYGKCFRLMTSSCLLLW